MWRHWRSPAYCGVRPPRIAYTLTAPSGEPARSNCERHRLPFPLRRSEQGRELKLELNENPLLLFEGRHLLAALVIPTASSGGRSDERRVIRITSFAGRVKGRLVRIVERSIVTKTLRQVRV